MKQPTTQENNQERPPALAGAHGSAHPWKMQMSAALRIAAAKREGARLRRLARYAEDTKDPVYRQSMTATHVAWESAKWHNDPQWREKRKEYYKAKRQGAPNMK